MWDLSFSALNEDSGFWPRLQRRCYGGFRRLSGLSQRFWLSRAYFPFLLWVALGFAALRQPVYGAMALLGICIWLLVFCRDLLASVTPFLLVFLLSTQRYESLGDFLPCAVLAAPFFAALIWHLMVWPVTFRVGRSATGLLLVSAATLLGGCGILSMHQLLQPLSLYYVGCLGGGMLVFYVLLRSCLTYSKGYDLHRRFAAIFCVLGVCMACLVMLDYAVRWQEFLQVHTTLYLKYRNFATALLLTTLPMSFYLSLKKPAHLLGVAVQAAGLALTGSRSALLFGVALLGLGFVYLVRWGLIPRKAVLPLCVAGTVLAVLVGPELLSLMMDSRMEDGHLFHQGDSVRVQLFLRGITDFLHNPVFGIGLISQRNSDLFTGVEGSMVFYHNSIAQIMGSMGLVGIAAYGVLMRDRIALLRAGKTPFVRALALSYLGMLLISLTNPGEFCPFPNAALMVMVFTLAEEATWPSPWGRCWAFAPPDGLICPRNNAFLSRNRTSPGSGNFFGTGRSKVHRIGKKEVFAYAVSTTNTCGRFPQDPPGPGRPARAGHLRRRALPRGRGAGSHQPGLRHGGAHILPGRHRRLRYPIRHPPARPALRLVSSLGHRRPQRAGLSGVGTASHVPAGGWPDGDGIRRSGDHPAGDAGASGVRKERA